jgi:hypothetical protein
MGIVKRHWKSILGIGSIFLAIWHSFVWLFDWETRIETFIEKFHQIGELGTVIQFLVNPPPWLALVALPVGLLLIFWDLRRTHESATIQTYEPDRREPDDWSLRELFRYLAPYLPLRASKKNEAGGLTNGIDPRWKPIGDLVLKPLSLGKLHATGCQRQSGKRLQAAPIPAEFWRDARFTYWFLDAGPSTVQDASNSRDSYAEIEVNHAEALALWPNGAEVSLLEGARQIYEAVKDKPIGIVIEGLNDGPDDVLAWVCNEIAMYRDGKEPLVSLRGTKPPSRTSEEIYTAPLTGYDFLVEGNAIVLQQRHGKARYESLTVSAVDVDRAIHELASRQI